MVDWTRLCINGKLRATINREKQLQIWESQLKVQWMDAQKPEGNLHSGDHLVDHFPCGHFISCRSLLVPSAGNEG
jgi:hypothetical protein